MKNKFYLKEFQHFDGEDDVIFNIIDVNENSNKSFCFGKKMRYYFPDYCFIIKARIKQAP